MSDKLTILLIEDNPVFIELASKILTEHDILEARDGKSALKVFAQNPQIDICFIDINLPDMTGIELLQKIRQSDENVYISMLTASRLVQDIEKSQQLSANGYILKPFCKKRLNKVIKDFHQKHKNLSMA